METLVECFRGIPKSEAPELEIRLGTLTTDERFCAGVGKQFFEQLEQDLLECTTLVAEPGWVEVVDHHYAASDGQEMRTRVTPDTDAIELRRQTIRKRPLQRVRCAVLARLCDEVCRVSLAQEEVVTTPPSIVIETHVRIKQRRCFRDVRDGKTVWSYELSRTWSGAGYEAAEYQQHNTEPTYEVELELVDEGGVYTSARDAGEIARGVEHKVKLLLGQPSQDIEVVDDPVRRSKKGERAHARAERARQGRPRQGAELLRRS
jgi:hypothetical protein